MPQSGRQPERLAHLARTIGVTQEDPITPLIKPRLPQVDVQDQNVVDEALTKTRLAHFQSQKHHLRSKPSRSPFTPKEASDTLETLVQSGCSPSQAFELIRRGADVNFSAYRSTKLWKRIRNQERENVRSTLFECVVEKGDAALVNVLAEKADQSNVDKGLEITLDGRDIDTTRVLMAAGANPNLYSVQFQNAVRNGDSEVVAAMAGGTCSLSEALTTQCLYDAVRLNQLYITQILLSRGADADTQAPSALSHAVESRNLALVAALGLARKPPSPAHLAKNIKSSCASLVAQSVPEDILMMTELLLVAGASGDAISQTLLTATQRSQHQLVELLVAYSEFNTECTPTSIKNAISAGDLRMFSSLLAIAPTQSIVDELLGFLPSVRSSVGCQERLEMTKLLVRSNPSGDALREALQDASEQQELLAVTCLVGAGASVDIPSSSVMAVAVKSQSTALLSILLTGKPSMNTLQSTLRLTGTLPTTLKVDFIRALLIAGVEGEPVNEALFVAVKNHDRSAMSYNFIEQLIHYGADVNTNRSQCFLLAISRADKRVLELLLQGLPNAESLENAFKVAMGVQDFEFCCTIVNMLLRAGVSGKFVDQALKDSIDGSSNGVKFARLILQNSTPDINHGNGEILRRAVEFQDIGLVRLLIDHTPSIDSLNGSLNQAIQLPNQTLRLEVCRIILQAGAKGQALDEALATVVESRPRDLDQVRLLLSFGASVDHDAGRALRIALSRPDDEILEILLKQKATSQTLVAALRLVLTNSSDVDRKYRICGMLLEVGPDIAQDSLGSLLHQTFDKSGKIETLQLFLHKGASVNIGSLEAFRKAIDNNDMNVLKLMLESSPTKKTIKLAFHHAWKAGTKYGLGMLRLITKDDSHRSAIDLDEYLVRAVRPQPCSKSLVQFLLDSNASVEHPEGRCVCLHIAAERYDNETLALLLKHTRSRIGVTAVFKKMLGMAELWNHPAGVTTTVLLLQHGASGEVVNQNLILAAERYLTFENAPAILDCLVDHQASSDYHDGQALELGVRKGNIKAVSRLFDANPSSATVANAFPYIFVSPADEQQTLELVDKFISCYGETLEMNAGHKELDQVLFQCLRKFPRSTVLLEALFRAGASFDQRITYTTVYGFEPESITPLLWALYQSRPVIDDLVIQLLIDVSGPNFTTPTLKVTPLIAAIKSSRAQIVKLLLARSADITVKDYFGQTPMCYATTQDDLEVIMLLLRKGAPLDDGSLHLAVERCRQIHASTLLEHEHDPNFTSHLHSGQPPLEILVRQQAYVYPPWKLKDMFDLLVRKGANPEYQVDGKSLLYMALDMPNAKDITPPLLSAFMGGLINEDFNLYRLGVAVYSPIMYVEKNKQESSVAQKQDLLRVLSSYRCRRVFYHLSGPQPEGFEGAPEEIRRRETRRLDRLHEIAEAQEQHEIEMRRGREAAAEQQRNMQLTHNLQLQQDDESARARERHAAIRRTNEINHARVIANEQYQATQRQSQLQIETKKQLSLQEQEITAAQVRASERQHQLQIEGKRQNLLQEQAAVDARLNGERQMMEMAQRNRQDQEAAEKRSQQRTMQEIAAKQALMNAHNRTLGIQREIALLQNSAQQQPRISYNEEVE